MRKISGTYVALVELNLISPRFEKKKNSDTWLDIFNEEKKSLIPNRHKE